LQIGCNSFALPRCENLKALSPVLLQTCVLAWVGWQAQIQNRKWNIICLAPSSQTYEHESRQKILKCLWREKRKHGLILLKLANRVTAPRRATKMLSHVVTLWTFLVLRDFVVAGIRNLGES
jgi:hypothetical protein